MGAGRSQVVWTGPDDTVTCMLQLALPGAVEHFLLTRSVHPQGILHMQATRTSRTSPGSRAGLSVQALVAGPLTPGHTSFHMTVI